MGEGCDPAVSPDGKRIAYATRPTRSDTSAADPGETAGNTIHLINLAGQNGWDPVSATGAEPGQPGQGLVVYGPVWSRDSRQLLVSVFIGNRVETDINLLTLVDASTAAQQLLGTSAGWNRVVSPAPDGSTYVLTAQNTGNARGSMGWDTWQTMVMDFVGTREMYLPDGTYTATGNPVGETLVRGQFTAWQPDGQALAVVLPPDWDPSIAPNEDYGRVDEPGELWLWPVAGTPSQQTSAPIDAGSPIQWLP
jgi:Tol biopolymer transport system component